jgi:galactokinase
MENEKSAAPFKNSATSSYKLEPDLKKRVDSLCGQFEELFQSQAEICVRSPGRAEILGNHTDYNQGYALSCAITKSILALMRKRNDATVHSFSLSFPGKEVVFGLEGLRKDSANPWSNYVRAVVKEMQTAGFKIGGADILIDSNLPFSGGVSSSAAFELAIGVGLTRLYGVSIDLLKLALLCKQAENGPLVETPCGFLDQASVALGASGKMVFLDFKAPPEMPVKASTVTARLPGYSFVLAVDPEVKRNLGDTGYPARRRMCEASLPLLTRLTGKKIAALRDVSIADFESCKAALAKEGGDTMRARVEHIVYEDQRVLDGVAALGRGDARAFGQIMSAAGHSALELYGLDEKTPELTLLVEAGRRIKGVMGTRNMGGGFSAITLSLVDKKAVEGFKAEISAAYQAKYKRLLEFIEFEAAQGVEVL